MARTDLQVNFRMPADLKERLEVAAHESRRSLTAEIVARLEESLETRPAVSDPLSFREELLIEELMRRLGERDAKSEKGD